MRHKKITIIVLLLFPLTLMSQDKKMLKAAKKGDAAAQVWIGNYFLGRGYESDLQQALMWYQMAAEKNYDRAQYLLGYCYEKGIGVKKDSVIATQWYEKAAQQHNMEAVYALNKLQMRGVALTTKNLPLQQEKESAEEQALFTIHPSSTNQKSSIIDNTFHHNISDVDIGLPENPANSENTFAIIFANENYQEEAKVDYALNDGEMLKVYCNKVLGLPESNIHFRKDATLNNIKAELSWMQQVAKAYKGLARFIVYYAGHGIPDEKSGTSYLLPIDGKGTMLDTEYSLTTFYETLGNLPAKNITVFMDACFSGAKRGNGMLASARGVAIKAKPQAPKGKMVVFSAAQGDETAYPFKEKEHGLFTYYLLKKLKDTKGNVTYDELGNYICEQVTRKSIVANGKSQTPTVVPSAGLADNWRTMKLK